MANTKGILALFLIMALFLTPAVAAQPNVVDIFDSLDVITGGQAPADFYNDHAIWVDFFVYLFLFIFVARFAFSKQEGMSKALPTVVGVALAIAATVGEAQLNFNLGQLGPFALAIALLVIGFTVYRLINGLGMGNGQAWAYAFVVVYGFLTTAASDLFIWINNKVPFVGSIFAIVLVVAIITVFMSVWGKLKGGGWTDLSGLGGNGGNDTSTESQQLKQERNAARKEEKFQDNELKELNKLKGIEQRAGNDSKKLIKDVDVIINSLKQADKGRITRENYQNIHDAVEKAQPDWGALKKIIDEELQGHVAALGKLEQAEMPAMRIAIQDAIKIVKEERKAAAQNPRNYGARVIDDKIKVFIQDAELRLQTKIAEESKEFERMISVAKDTEGKVGGFFQQAMAAIQRGSIRLAITFLENAKSALRQLDSVLEQSGRTNIEHIKREVMVELRDFQNVDKMAARARRELGQL